MNTEQILVATGVWAILTAIVFTHSKWSNIRDCFALWLQREYWTSYNIVEALSWAAKAMIIIPGLVFGIQIWQFYWIALITSLGLIWSSNKKLLPSVVAFNVIWAWLSCMVLAKHLIN